MGDQDSAAKQSDPQALADSKAPVSGAPTTDDIDSEWSTEGAPPSASAASDPGAASKPPRTEDVDSGWLAEGEPGANALTKPIFPEDPGVPSDLAPPASEKPEVEASAPSSERAAAKDEPALATKPVSSTPPVPARAADSGRASSERKVADAAEGRRVSRHSEAAPTQKGGSRWIGLLLLVVAVGGIAVVKGSGSKDEPVAAEPAPTPARDPELTAARTPEPAPELPAARAEATPQAGPVASEIAAPVVSAAAPAPSAPQVAGEPATPAGTKRVVIDVTPPEARIYHRGKSVGKPPVTIELEPGKRRSFEVAAPGYTTRKIVVDGSKPEISVGLRPVPASTDAARSP